jgi:hypothetical protein
MPPHPVLCELVSGTPAAFALVVRPLDGITLDIAAPGNLYFTRFTLLLDIQAHGVNVAILRKGIEGDPDTESVGERDFFLHRFALLELAFDKFTPQKIRVIFRQKMTTVGGYIDQDVFRRRIDLAIQGAFKHFVTQLSDFKGQVVTEEDKAVRLILNGVEYFRQIDQVFLFDLDKS